MRLSLMLKYISLLTISEMGRDLQPVACYSFHCHQVALTMPVHRPHPHPHPTGHPALRLETGCDHPRGNRGAVVTLGDQVVGKTGRRRWAVFKPCDQRGVESRMVFLCDKNLSSKECLQ